MTELPTGKIRAFRLPVVATLVVVALLFSYLVAVRETPVTTHELRVSPVERAPRVDELLAKRELTEAEFREMKELLAVEEAKRKKATDAALESWLARHGQKR